MSRLYCGNCHRPYEAPPEKAAPTSAWDGDAFVIIEPYFCPFCKDKGFFIYRYELSDSNTVPYGSATYDPDRYGVESDLLVQLMRQYKTDVMALNVDEPRNLVEMLVERHEQIMIKKGYEEPYGTEGNP